MKWDWRKWKQSAALLLVLALCLSILPHAAYAVEADAAPTSEPSDAAAQSNEVEWGQIHAVANERVRTSCKVHYRDPFHWANGQVYFIVQVDEPGELEIASARTYYYEKLVMWNDLTSEWYQVDLEDDSRGRSYRININESGVYSFCLESSAPDVTRTIDIILNTDQDPGDENPPENNYSLHVASSKDDYRFPVGSTMELAFSLYCNDEPVGPDYAAEQEYTYEIEDMALFDMIDEIPLKEEDGTTVGLALSLRSGSTAGKTKLTVTEVHTGAQAQIDLETYVAGYSLNVQSNHSACSVETGDELILSFELLRDGEPVGFNSTQISFAWEDGAAESNIFTNKGQVILDPTEAQEGWGNWCSYAFEAKTAGNAVLTVTAKEMFQSVGTSIRLYLTAYDDSAYTRFNEVPVVSTNDGISTNYYNVDGLYVEEFHYQKIDDQNYNVNFTVYNTLSLYGAVTVYDKDQTIVDVVKIDQFSNLPESWYGYSEEDGINSEVLEFLWNRYTYFANCLADSTADVYGYRNPSMAEKTEISVTVPQDGYITISTDMFSEPAVWIYNTFGLMLNGSKLASKSIKLNQTDIDKVLNKTAEKALKKMPVEVTSEMLKKIIKKYETNIENVYVDSSFYDDFDIHAEISSILGEDEYFEILEESLADAAVSTSGDLILAALPGGNIAKLWLDSFEHAMTIDNIIIFAAEYCSAIHGGHGATTTLYTPLDSSSGMTDVDKGVITIIDSEAKDTSVLSVEAEQDYMKTYGDTFFIAEHSYSASSQAAIERVKALLNSKEPYLFAAYNLYFKDSNGEIIDIKGDKGKFTITMTIPDGLSADSLGVYRIEDDGTPTLLDFTVNKSAGTVTFVTDHFSLYIFSSKTEKEIHTHGYGTEWRYNEESHWRECACGATDDEALHTWQWIIDKEATASEKGSKHQECTVCGYKDVAVEIPATNSEGSTTKPNTGDSSNMARWFVLLAASIFGLSTMLLFGRKRKTWR